MAEGPWQGCHRLAPEGETTANVALPDGGSTKPSSTRVRGAVTVAPSAGTEPMRLLWARAWGASARTGPQSRAATANSSTSGRCLTLPPVRSSGRPAAMVHGRLRRAEQRSHSLCAWVAPLDRASIVGERPVRAGPVQAPGLDAAELPSPTPAIVPHGWPGP